MTIPDNGISKSDFIHLQFRSHQLKTSIQHWQLRDLLTFSSGASSDLLAVYHNQVTRYNPKTMTLGYSMRELSFSPTCMAAAHGYLAVGGQRSQVVVRHLETSWMAQASVGGAINNAIHISEHSGEVRLIVSNNDESIKIFALPTMTHICSISLPTAVNGVSVSPDGTKMVAVGDTDQAFLFNIGPGQTYQQIASLPTSKDAGFSCGWDRSSSIFAVGCQDGFACVYDIRSCKKLAQIASCQGNQRGAVRCVKFAQSGSIDLLAFSEHNAYFNIVDTRNFEDRESIRIGPPNNDVNISGIVFSPDSRSIFISTEQQVLEYDVNTRKRRGFPAGQVF